MAEPAREAAREPAGQAREPDPAQPCWPEILAAEVGVIRAAVQELARRPGDAAALETARLNAAVAEKLAALARRVTFDEQRLAAERRLGYDEGVAACRAARCRLGVIDGGRAGAG